MFSLFKKLFFSFFYSLKGLRILWEEAAFKIEVVASVFIVPFGYYVAKDGTEASMLIGFWLMVPLVESINTAFEKVVDRIGVEHNELSGQAKDLGSCSVLISLMVAAIVWVNILLL